MSKTDDKSIEERITRIEKWIDFWETIETGWNTRTSETNKPSAVVSELNVEYHESNFDSMRDAFLIEALRCAGHNPCDENLWKGICRAAAKRIVEKSNKPAAELCRGAKKGLDVIVEICQDSLETHFGKKYGVIIRKALKDAEVLLKLLETKDD